jgi:hypothetical protein
MGLDAGKYFWRSGREKCFSLDIPFNRTFGPGSRRVMAILRQLAFNVMTGLHTANLKHLYRL